MFRSPVGSNTAEELFSFPRRRAQTRWTNFLPLINIIFLLLAFFIIAGQLTPAEEAGVSLPNAVSGGPAQESDMVVALSKDGDVWVDGMAVPREQLAQAVAQLLAVRPEAQVRLHADAGLSSRSVLDAMRDITRAGGQHVALMVQNEASR